MKYLTVIFAAIFLGTAASLSVSVVESSPAQAASGGYVKKCGGGKILLNAKEKETFVRHNQIRRNHNLRTFCVHPKLQRAARAHSKDMIRRDYFSHDTKGGGSADQRVKKFGYNYRYFGENIAYGSGSSGTPRSIMRSWMHSSGHRHNILTGRFREIGIGTYTGTYKGYKGITMYTADFGTRR